MNALIHYREGTLSWYTRDTGNVCCSPDYNIHFGINSIGLINVYAKDIALLPEWQQIIWAGYNIGPEGKVSRELLSAQMEAKPASTKAPEQFLGKGLTNLNHLFETKIGITVIRQHDQIADLIARCHRFRSVDREGLFSLAKDLARLTADSIDAAALHKIAPPAKGEKLGSLKSMEKLIAIKIGMSTAKTIMSALFGIYELRLADAHPISKDVDAALQLVMVDPQLPFVVQGYQLLDACVGTIFRLCEVIENWK